MNQRRGTSNRNGLYVTVGVVVLALVAGLVLWLALRDDGSPVDSPDPGTTPTAKSFVQQGIPFTFEYPATFAPNEGPEGYIWIAGVGPYDMLNVKRIANEARTLAQLTKSSREALVAVPGLTIVSEGTTTRDGTEMATFVTDTVLGDKTLHSQFFYFALAEVTWQLECESYENADVIDDACDRALETFKALVVR